MSIPAGPLCHQDKGGSWEQELSLQLCGDLISAQQEFNFKLVHSFQVTKLSVSQGDLSGSSQNVQTKVAL